ncbi:MAG: AzlD domain-containing protein [Coriobacteriales bacterium]|nr:AzlD domain-containing protein [Actinomycetes bacterium]
MRPQFIVLIVAMAVVTYVTRVSLIGVARQFELHPLLIRALEYVPVAILAALVFPVVVAPSRRLALPFTNAYVWAALVTAVTFMVTKRQVPAIMLGVGGLVIARALSGA